MEASGQLDVLAALTPVQNHGVGRDSVVGIATRYGLDGPGIGSRWGATFSTTIQAGPGAHPPSIQRVPGLSRG